MPRACGQASLRRYVHETMPEEAARSAVTVRKDDPPPGEAAQIEYGYLGVGGPGVEPPRRVWAFVMVLAASQHMFVRPVVAVTLAAWIDAHTAAFAFFGGLFRRWAVSHLPHPLS